VPPYFVCLERVALQKQFHEAFRAYIEATRGLETASLLDHFDEALDSAEGAKVAFLRARFALHKHGREHGCETASHYKTQGSGGSSD
jgi:hypothetical protein